MCPGGAEYGYVPMGEALQPVVERNPQGLRKERAVEEGKWSESERHASGLDQPGTLEGLVDKTAAVAGRSHIVQRLTTEPGSFEHMLDVPLEWSKRWILPGVE